MAQFVSYQISNTAATGLIGGRGEASHFRLVLQPYFKSLTNNGSMQKHQNKVYLTQYAIVKIILHLVAYRDTQVYVPEKL